MAQSLPRVGYPVHYRSLGTPNGEFTSECRAAIITEVNADEDPDNPPDMVGLVVFNPTGTYLPRGVLHDEDKPGGTWHWPC